MARVDAEVAAQEARGTAAAVNFKGRRRAAVALQEDTSPQPKPAEPPAETALEAAIQALTKDGYEVYHCKYAGQVTGHKPKSFRKAGSTTAVCMPCRRAGAGVGAGVVGYDWPQAQATCTGAGRAPGGRRSATPSVVWPLPLR